MRNKRIYINISELNLLLLFATLFSCGLVVVRVLLTQSSVYMSLIWNLFLAWVPYLISYKTRQKNKEIKKTIYLYIIFFWWLVFYPNAPYILTDLFHLNERGGAPLWFDLILIVSFALTGVILGLLSLKDMQEVFTLRINYRKGWWFVITSLMLSGFGVYLGRYLRWNSWDVILQVNGLTLSLFDIVTNPFQNARAYGFTILFGLFQLALYFCFYKFIQILSLSNRSL